MKYCSKCGQPVEDGSLFCSYCGAPQTQDQVDPQQVQPTQQVDQGFGQRSQDNSQNSYSQDSYSQNNYSQNNYPQNNYSQNNNPNAYNQNYSQPNQNMNQAGPNQTYNQFDQGYAQPNQNINQNFGQTYNPNVMNNGAGYNPNANSGAATGNGFGNKVGGAFANIKNSLSGKINLSDKKTIIIIASAAGVLMILLILLIGSLSMRGAASYKGAVKKMMNSMASGNAKKTVHVMFTRKMEKALDQELKDGDLEYMGYDSTVDFIEDVFEDELEDGVKIRDVDISDKDKMTKKQIRDFEEDIEDDMGIKVNVSQAYELEIEYEYREKGDKKWTDDEMDVTAYKVGGRWYIFPF